MNQISRLPIALRMSYLLSFDNATNGFTWIDPSTLTTTETNDLTSAVTWANVPDANITESSVTQHQGAIDHGSIAGLGDDDHTQYALLAGRSGDKYSKEEREQLMTLHFKPQAE